VIQTDRLILRPAVDADRAAVAAINADPLVGAWLGGVRDRAWSDAFIDQHRAYIARHGFGYWVVERQADRRVIGMAGLWDTFDGYPFGTRIQVGWRLASDAWGQGYATEAARAALDYGFDVLKLPEVIAITARSNLASQAVMGRIGMVLDPARDFEHPAVPEDDPLRPHVTFAATR
jgi:RimJ/RimL family protein N-acetyltransferase